MSFRQVKNMASGKVTFFIDGKRVSQSSFEMNQFFEELSGKRKNSMILYHKDGKEYFCFCID